MAAPDCLDVLRHGPLLSTDQAGQLAALEKQFPDFKALLRELVRRGWLSPFQANQLAAGKGQELVLDQYVLIDLLGQGGMGQVFKARQVSMDRLVAVKVIRREALKSPGAVERFAREARAAAKLSHPNIVTVFDSRAVNGLHFLVMEYLEGTDLAGLLRKQGIPSVGAACDYIRQAALGLQHAHEQGLVHRDIKPHNLMLTKKGVIKVMDLGLARTANSADAAASEGLTGTGAIMGTADYMAPEQGMSAKRVDIRADVYSLGCTLYQLLSGQVPFPGDTMAQKLVGHQLSEPEPVEKLRPELPPGLAPVVRKMMAKDAAQRYQTPGEVAQALGPFAGTSNGAVPAASMTVADHASEPSGATLAFPPHATHLGGKRRRWFLVAGLAAVALVLLLFAVLPSRTPDTRPKAEGTGPDSPPDPLVVNLGDGVKLELVLIKKGSFKMGSPDSDKDADVGGDANRAVEKPQHDVQISKDFYLGKYPVTQEQYQRLMGKNPSQFSKDGERKKDVEGMDTRRFPVENVTWTEAREFCEKLSQRLKRRVELPTEAQWEYACRAGTTTRYYCGDSLDPAFANYTSRGQE